MSDLMPCPFCGGELLAWGASAFRHPSGKCILSDRVFDRRFRGQWNTRTVQAQIDAAVLAERERCAQIAKTKWLTAMDDLDEWGIGNADREMNLSYITEAAIRKGDQP